MAHLDNVGKATILLAPPVGILAGLALGGCYSYALSFWIPLFRELTAIIPAICVGSFMAFVLLATGCRNRKAAHAFSSLCAFSCWVGAFLLNYAWLVYGAVQRYHIPAGRLATWDSFWRYTYIQLGWLSTTAVGAVETATSGPFTVMYWATLAIVLLVGSACVLQMCLEYGEPSEPILT